jgi:alkylglycerol monooxygenase
MSPILFAIPVFLATMGLELWVRRLQAKQTYDLADALGSLHLGVLSQVVGAFSKLATLGVYVLVYERFATYSWDLSNPLAWLAALLLYDLLYYWYHRLGHEVRVLWAAHVVHHSSEHYNLSTALRQSSSGALLGWLFYLPMAVMGVPPKLFVIVGLIDLLYQYWVHTETIHQLGWFDRIFVSPSNHRVHHGQNDYCIDRNYGGILIVWDRLFGTYAPERADEKIIYGVRKPLRSLSPLWGNLHLYAELWRDMKTTPGFWNKLDLALQPPSGWNNQNLGHFAPAHFEPYQVQLKTRLALYVSFQYVLTLTGFAYFLFAFNQMSALQSAALAAWLLVGMIASATMMHGQSWGKVLECLRLAATLPLCLTLGLL